METVGNNDEIQKLSNNKIIGNPNLVNSNISFNGNNNILYCESNVNIVNSSIRFIGDNSLIYLSSNKNNYPLNIQIFQSSVIYMGKNNTLSATVNMDIQEHQNLIIGDECIIGSNTTFKTSDGHLIYDSESKIRINPSKSIFIGDHVWIGHQSYICKGAILGSGLILDNNSHVGSNFLLKSNNLYSGNPVSLTKANVFFIENYVGNFTKDETNMFNDYKSNVFLYSNTPNETLDLARIDELLSNFSINEKINFIQKLFIQNKKHNRFSM